jgi:hypothetical protein
MFQPLRQRAVRILWCLCLVLLASSAFSRGDEVSDSEKRLRDSAHYLASDKLEGRGLTTQGINLAADYIVEQFRAVGMRTDVFNGSPFQEFTIISDAKLGKTNEASLVGPDGKETKLKLGQEYTPTKLGGGGDLSKGVPLVFVGYGIAAKDFGYDDFAGIDVKGKAVVILRKEPQQGDAKSKFNGTDNTPHAFFTRKISNAYQHGAAAVVLVNDYYEIRTTAARLEKQIKANMAESAKLVNEIGESVPSLEQADKLSKAANAVATARRRLDDQRDPLMPFDSGGVEDLGRDFPVITLRRAAIDPVVKAALGKDLATLEEEIDKDLKPRSAELKGWSLRGQVSVDRTRTKIKNVVGVMEGFGPLADETVVIGAHYDHLGFGGPGSLAPGSKEIHNGADDNGSGIATMLEIARQIADRKARSRFRAFRRIVFIAFTGEERGLLGSAHYADHSPFDMKKTVAMLNLDMVGRMQDERLIIQGADTAKEFGPLVEKFNKDLGFKITHKSGGFGPSDHTSFYAKNVPVMHFFTDTHPDYHRPSDDADKLNIPGMRKIGAMVTDIAMSVAGEEARPTFVQVKTSVKSPSGRKFPSFGSIPDYSFQGKGYRLSGVRDGLPAQKAGLKAGDVMIQFDKNKIGTVDDFFNALQNFSPGDKVKVTVLRDGKETTVEVTLGEPQ